MKLVKSQNLQSSFSYALSTNNSNQILNISSSMNTQKQKHSNLVCNQCSKYVFSESYNYLKLINNSTKLNEINLNGCLNCSKFLPQCLICLRLMKINLQPNPIGLFGNWFAWCQNCKHGGHIKHLIEWFKYHEVCSFLKCKCQCIYIDVNLDKLLKNV